MYTTPVLTSTESVVHTKAEVLDSNIVWSFGEDIFRLVALAPKSVKRCTHRLMDRQTPIDLLDVLIAWVSSMIL